MFDRHDKRTRLSPDARSLRACGQLRTVSYQSTQALTAFREVRSFKEMGGAREVSVGRTEACEMAQDEEVERRDRNAIRLEERVARDEVALLSREPEPTTLDPREHSVDVFVPGAAPLVASRRRNMKRRELLNSAHEVFVVRTEVCKVAREEDVETRDGNLIRRQEWVARDEVFLRSREPWLMTLDPL
jgi:hypothetical protein